MSISKASFALLVALTASFLCGGLSCGGNKKGAMKSPIDNGGDSRVLVQDGDQPSGLQIRLSEGADQAPPSQSIPAAKADTLGEAQTRALLARLSALPQAATRSHALPERSPPPPRPGTTVSQAFPPPQDTPPPAGAAAQGGALEVVRHAPEGEVPLAPHLSITFSQPMIAVTAHADAAAQVPVKLAPMPAGQWRWVGTRTLLFDPDPRFPQATEYAVEIPAGTTSAVGGVLDKAVSWRFTTPAPRVLDTWPPASSSQPHERTPAMFVLFDQAVNAEAALATIAVEAKGTRYPVRALSEQEIAAEPMVRERIAGARSQGHEERYVVFTVTRPLPADALATLTVGPGTPSREGPLRTKEAHSTSFRTYGPLKVEETRCGWREDCPPLTPWTVRMSNPLDAAKLDPAAIRVRPELPGMRVDVSGQYLTIRGRSQGRTTYTVTLPATLTDQFGQTLETSEPLTFRVGSADPSFWGPSGLVVLDPAARRRTLSVYSINHQELAVRLYQVTPAEWQAFAGYMRDPFVREPSGVSLKTPPGNKVVDTKVSVSGKPDEMVETAIDLMPALNSGLGQVVAVIEPLPRTQQRRRRPNVIHAWVQATNIGLDAFSDDTELLAWATRLDTGAPLAGVELEIQPAGIRGSTGQGGTARLALSSQSGSVLVATLGEDVAMLPESQHWWSDYGGWTRRTPETQLRWYVFDDRQLYRPGETVHLKGWLRRMDPGKGGDILPLTGTAVEATYVVHGPRGNELSKGTIRTDALGGFDLAFDVPKTSNLGWARVDFESKAAGAGAKHSHGFQIQEFRRPEFEVSASASEGPHLVGSGADVTVSARYYAGGPLAGADVTWEVRTQNGRFTPPNRDDYVFGEWVPWWGVMRGPRGEPGMAQPPELQTLASKTDAVGKHTLHLDFLSVAPPRPMRVSAQAAVMDVNRQSWTASSDLLVHPATVYVGLKRDAYFVDQGKPIDIDGIVVDLDGEAVAGTALTMRAARMDWVLEEGEYVTKEMDPQVCAKTSGEGPVRCSFATGEGGEYKVSAEVVDDQGRRNRTELTIWVAGGKRPPARDVEQEQVTLIPDQAEYQPGDTASILVQAPFYPAEGLLTVRRSGIVSTERFTLDGPTATLRVPIVEAHIPNVFVQVDVVGAAARVSDDGEVLDDRPKRPAYAAGSLELPVPPLARTLAVTVTPKARKLAPGGETTLAVAVRDAAGKPVGGAQVAVVVVDEAVLALADYQVPDPVAQFYGKRSEGVSDRHLRQAVKLARPELVGDELAQTDGVVDEEAREESMEAPPPPGAPAPAAAGRADRSMAMKRAPGGGGQAQAPIAVRTNMSPLAVFAPAVATDDAGQATVAVKLPDNLTRYRVTAVAVAETRYFGKGESAITARLPLMVRPSPPRFLNVGDRFELPVVVQNQTDAAMRVEVAVRASNLALTQGQGRALTVAANDRVEVRFAAAAELPGTAHLQIAAASGSWADAADAALPVWTPATTEAFATYGELDSGAMRQPVAMPGAVVEELGGVTVTTSSTQLQALTDAFLYLVSYPFDCTEQVASRLLGVAALRDVMAAFAAPDMPTADELESAVARDLDKLSSLQGHDGGFGFWRQSDQPWPYVSIHAAHALARMKQKGFTVPARLLERSTRYLQNIDGNIPSWYPPQARATLIAYALHVRQLLGEADSKQARALLDRYGRDELPLEAIGWLLPVLATDSAAREEVAGIHRMLDNRATETAATASYASSYEDGAHLLLHSSRRADALLVDALIATKPRSDLIPKLVRGLLGHRTRGRWLNTQENVFVLLALDRYFGAYEKVTPSFVARVWLGERFAGEHAFRGRTTESHEITIPMAILADLGSADLTLQKTGKGRLYYRIGMTYAPQSLTLAPADHGFAVQRTYEPVDDPGDVTRLPDGRWKMRAGARVRVRLEMVAPSRRYHVALVDPLPAGLEPLNPALATTGTLPQDPQAQQSGSYWWWQRTWYEHQNLRDERVEAFASLLWAGVHEYTYVARATTPGSFVVPPARAEEMYAPETFGRSGSDAVLIE